MQALILVGLNDAGLCDLVVTCLTAIESNHGPSWRSAFGTGCTLLLQCLGHLSIIPSVGW